MGEKKKRAYMAERKDLARHRQLGYIKTPRRDGYQESYTWPGQRGQAKGIKPYTLFPLCDPPFQAQVSKATPYIPNQYRQSNA